MTTLYANVISWLTEDKADPKVAARETVSAFVAPNAVGEVAVADLTTESPDVYVIGKKVGKQANPLTDAEVDAIVDFVSNGGSVIYAGDSFDAK